MKLRFLANTPDPAFRHDVHDALAYAYDHLDEIESDLAADDETAVKAQFAQDGSS